MDNPFTKHFCASQEICNGNATELHKIFPIIRGSLRAEFSEINCCSTDNCNQAKRYYQLNDLSVVISTLLISIFLH